MLWTKGADQSADINQIPYVIFQAMSQSFFKFCITLSVMTYNFSEIF